MIWVCKEHIKCECGAGFPPTYTRTSKSMCAKAQYRNALATRSKDPQPLQDFWQMLVRDYTAKKVTYDSDRHISLDGVVKQMKNVLICDYYAGLWPLNSPQALTWRTAFCTPGRRPDKYRAPPRSWASVEH